MSKTLNQKSKTLKQKSKTLKHEEFDNTIDFTKINYFMYNISTEKNTDNNYIETGLISILDSQGLNLIRRNISKLRNAVGLTGINTHMYNYCVNSVLKKVNEEMKKQKIDKISNAKIQFILPQKSLFGTKNNNASEDINSENINNITDFFSGGGLTTNVTILTQINIFFMGTGLIKVK